MHDIKFIRENPDIFDANMKRRGLDSISAKILAIDEQIRSVQTELQGLLSKRNDMAKNIGLAKRNGEDVSALMAEGEELKKLIPELESKLEAHQNSLQSELDILPNFLSEDVPDGNNESDNKEIKKVGEKRNFDFTPKHHFELGEALGMMDFEQTSKLSGARFVTLKSGIARLERALVNLMLDNHTLEFGYTEIVHPALVRSNAVYGSGQLPKFEEDLFKTTNDYYLISTSEVFLTNLVADKIINEEELPLRFTAYSSCFRSEGGSAGKDTRGMIRQHQFSKVELVSITNEKDSFEEHEMMLAASESVLKKLDLPYRVVALCSGDIGFQSTKTYDIEVWLPGQNQYREIASCSNCLDFQARRMKGRFKRHSDKKNYFVHTLNGSGLPIGRTIIAIMENYQNADGSITIPDKLIPYMGGMKKIER
jgi:seryl-tRNA synthetase